MSTPVAGAGRKANVHRPGQTQRRKKETQAEIFARKKQKVTKPKLNHGRALCKKQSEGCAKTAKILHPKKQQPKLPAEVKPKPKIHYEEPNITVAELRSKALQALEDSKGHLTDPQLSLNTPLYILLRNYRKLSTDNPKYIDHYTAVYKIYKRQYDKEISAALSR